MSGSVLTGSLGKAEQVKVRTLETRSLTHADLRQIEALHEVATCDPPVGLSTIASGEASLSALVENLLSRDSFALVGAFYDGELIGVGVARHVCGKEMADHGVVHIEVLYVRPDFRRRGIGQLLMREVADWAALLRAQHVVCLPLPSAKRARRYLAKLGFFPGVSYRVISTDQLRRRLGASGRRRRGERVRALRAG